MMSRAGPTIAVFLSEHGFGHGVRSGWLLAELRRRRPELRLLIASQLPRWLFEGLGQVVGDERLALPSPLVQSDVLAVDHQRSAIQVERTLDLWDEQVDGIHRWLVEIGAGLVYCDVPAQPLVAARRAGVAAVALGNFTWDWIYQGYADRHRIYGVAARRLAEAYRAADLYLRLPPSPAAPAGVRTQELCWLVRKPRCSRAQARRALGILPEQTAVLLSFGGHPGLPLAELAGGDLARRYRILSGRQLAQASGDGIEAVDEDKLAAHGLGYVDLVHAADLVLSKPGYGIIADCMACRTRLIYLERPEFPEVALLEPHLDCELAALAIPRTEQTVSGIGRSIERALRQPRPNPTAPLDGLDQAARAVLATVHGPQV